MNPADSPHVVVDVRTHPRPRSNIELIKKRSQISLVVMKGQVEEFVILAEERQADPVGRTDYRSRFLRSRG